MKNHLAITILFSALTLQSAFAEYVDLEPIIETINGSTETECVDCALKSLSATSPTVTTAVSDIACRAIQGDENDLKLDRLDSISETFKLKGDPEIQSAIGKLRVSLSSLPGQLREFASCLGKTSPTQMDGPGDYECSTIGEKCNTLTTTIREEESKVRALSCKKLKGPDATQFSSLLGLTTRSIVSEQIFNQLAPYAPLVEKTSYIALANGKSRAVQQLSDLVSGSIQQTFEAKNAVDWYRLKLGFSKKKKKMVMAVEREERKASECFQRNLAQAVLRLRKSGKSRKEINELVSSLKDLQSEVKRSGGSINQALKTKAINTLTIIGNLTWGLPNTSVGVLVGLASVIVHPFIPKEDREPLDIKFSDNGKQIKLNSQLIYGSSLSFEASLGGLETDQEGANSTSHEGGHAVQSAILGPLYFPAIGLSYLLSGFDSGKMEEWATRVGQKTQPNKPETVFGCHE